jgi:hypothetical protein
MLQDGTNNSYNPLFLMTYWNSMLLDNTASWVRLPVPHLLMMSCYLLKKLQ